MSYKVIARMHTNFTELTDSLETDDIYEVNDFIFEHRQRGFECELTKINELYDDLRMEQCEQM